MTLLKFFELFSGPTAMLLSIITTITVTWRTRKSRYPGVRGFFAGLLLWPPIFLMFCMVMHISFNSFNAIVSIRGGQAIFAFYHYGLLLFGATVGTQAVLMARQVLRHNAGGSRFDGKLYFHIIRIVVTTLPTLMFTVIGIVPTVLMAIATIVSFFTHRRVADQKVKAEEEASIIQLEPAVA